MRECRVSDIVAPAHFYHDFPVKFEEQISALCQEVIACKSEEQAIELARRIQSLMHARIEELRGNLITLPPIGPTGIDKQSA